MDVAGIHSALNQKSHKILFFVYLFCIHFAGFAYILLVLHICNILFHLYGGHIGVDNNCVDALLLQRLDRLQPGNLHPNAIIAILFLTNRRNKTK